MGTTRNCPDEFSGTGGISTKEEEEDSTK